jgi:small-conductance mechanosensitive channel
MIPRRLVFALLLGAPGLMAQPAALNTAREIDDTRAELAVLEEQINSAGNSLQAQRQASALRKRLVAIRARSRECVEAAGAQVQALNERRAALEEPAADEAQEVANLRRVLDSDLSGAEKRQAACKQITQISRQLLDLSLAREQAALLERLFARGVSTPRVLVAALQDPFAWSRLVSGFLDEGSGWERLSALQHGTVLVAFLILLAAGFAWRRRWFARHGHEGTRQHLFSALPWLLPGIGTCGLLITYLHEWPPALISRLALAILVWLVIDVLVRMWLSGRRAAGLAAQDARALVHWFRLLAALVIVGGLIITAEAVIQLPDAHYFVLRTVMVWLLLLGMAWSAVILAHVPGLAGSRALRALVLLVVLAIAVAETLGFRNLSLYLLLGFGGTVGGFIVFGIAARSLVFLYDGMDEGRYAWQQALRRSLGLKPRELVPGLIWLRLASSLLVWSGFVLWVLWVWGQTERWVSKLVQYATEGFNIGSLRIEPLQILAAIAALAIGISFTRWIKQGVVSDLVTRTRLDRGGRDAIVTVSGYTGVTLSVLIALGIAGISYTNLVIIAGALSVGIGFGLQNVVNNFISGLILLFERPIRTGDWVVVGDTQGYVRRISIRSTQIETFDRADVIVPNSELVTSKVSNWMLRDSWGRITIPVGVAYGSDVQQVVEILLRIAREHQSVLRDQPGVAAPKALFRHFGDSALEFELRCFISQIDRVIDVTHDLNMAIDKAFREAGITIPFPQRDIHVKDSPVQGGGNGA